MNQSCGTEPVRPRNDVNDARHLSRKVVDEEGLPEKSRPSRLEEVAKPIGAVKGPGPEEQRQMDEAVDAAYESREKRREPDESEEPFWKKKRGVPGEEGAQTEGGEDEEDDEVGEARDAIPL